MADAEDLARERALPAGEVDAVVPPRHGGKLLPRYAVGEADRGDGVGGVARVGEELEAGLLNEPTGERAVVGVGGVDLFDAAVEDETEALTEAVEDGEGGCPRGLAELGGAEGLDEVEIEARHRRLLDHVPAAGD